MNDGSSEEVKAWMMSKNKGLAGWAYTLHLPRTSDEFMIMKKASETDSLCIKEIQEAPR
jgi:hypothetical protein